MVPRLMYRGLANLLPPPLLRCPPSSLCRRLPLVPPDDFVQRKYLVTGDMTFSVYMEDTWFHDSASDFGRPGGEALLNGHG